MSTDIFTLKFGINRCYLIRGNGIIMIDACPPDKFRAFKRKLARLYINPEEIKLIVLTHSHFDNAGSAKDIKELTGAKIAIHENEQTYLEDGGFAMPKGVNTWGKIISFFLFPFYKRISVPKVKADVVITGNEFTLTGYGVDGKIIHTPGHTHGSISLLLNSGESFVGGLAQNGFPFRIQPGLAIYAQDNEKAKESCRLLIEMGAREIFPGHGKSFPVEAIRKFMN